MAGCRCGGALWCKLSGDMQQVGMLRGTVCSMAVNAFAQPGAASPVPSPPPSRRSGALIPSPIGTLSSQMGATVPRRGG
ncbi:hypothetical protein XAP412_970037 [Xanthomonas phaseoli pv. phaseoli]|uniref:Uncharacterized protein n=1 Tax=Xanthomonas campestris pv. phaseoli TaxID=317013 RepID=A0AB38E8Q5_XANCH|nr:hypothetical protein XAP6984_1000036 [Xanthomonas phaseoli pv. phaseoli]SON91982.1 hypothetical protein XAP412_970037 [Xanthomonas phaseoli pv. phaseoli]SON93232.1 hypothetical protein XAP7430_990037 [Xanthomonas phaseoli pv. phaseoli]